MRTIKLLLTTLTLGILTSSCYTEVIIEEEYIEDPIINNNAVLQSYDLWYVDINETTGNGEVPFLQRAFTVSFIGKTIYANNNLVGIGKTGNGFGMDVGDFNTLNESLQINHDVDGYWKLEIFVVDNNTIELYDANSRTSYFLEGFQRNNFDYDMIFYDNLHYLLQEYEVWEKIATSEEGAVNDFDSENYLQFYNDANKSIFNSSVDPSGMHFNDILWDYRGEYSLFDVYNDETLKTLTLDYEFMDNDYFELYVINDSTIELYHSSSGTVYKFRGKGFITYLKSGKSQVDKKRTKTELGTMKVARKRKI
ncbi:nicotinic acid mononucleotide adenyltransferase [Arenibacter sp. BSSL-BM3]|uniref:Nicotinic acid mononucleotide adenyltransferase n=1 Tax=Arenibacter arenosicollis TaxID=2762274 RepID=A0ABR7QHN9_9FLAO|nr:nicotinic acid mononucleotide adenyltransferase [Arenibacter arenosicollis]MBC8766672.1 nicotinic acid mononucleotide adenyltransferase [Arenibacter arenosicollis]